MPKEIIDRYLDEVRAATAAVDAGELVAVSDALMDVWRRGGTVYALGNGGSASLASHLACDLGKNTSPDLGAGFAVPAARRLRVVGLADNAALLTALGNDIGFEDVYVEQLKLMLTANDLVLAISGSGSSGNVLGALRYARMVGAGTIVFTGARQSAAEMLALADHAVRAPVETMEQIEDLHVIFNHVLAVVLRDRIARQDAAR